jgi:hypothetical protein
MGIKIKYIDPKISDFGMEDFIVNAQTGDIFYKANKKLFKLKGDDISTKFDKVSLDSNFEANQAYFKGYTIGDMIVGSNGPDAFSVGSPAIEVKGSILPIASEDPIYDLGSEDRPFRHLVVSDGSIRMVKVGMGIGFSRVGTSFIIGRYGRATLKSEETRLTKSNIDDLKAGRSISGSGDMRITGNLSVEGNLSVNGDEFMTLDGGSF